MLNITVNITVISLFKTESAFFLSLPVTPEQQLQSLLGHLLPAAGAGEGAPEPAAEPAMRRHLDPEESEHVGLLVQPRGQCLLTAPLTSSSRCDISSLRLTPLFFRPPLVLKVMVESSDSFRPALPVTTTINTAMHSQIEWDQGGLFQVRAVFLFLFCSLRSIHYPKACF